MHHRYVSGRNGRPAHQGGYWLLRSQESLLGITSCFSTSRQEYVHPKDKHVKVGLWFDALQDTVWSKGEYQSYSLSNHASVCIQVRHKYVKAGSIFGILAHSPKLRLNVRPSL